LDGILRFECPDDYAQVFLPTLLRGFAQHHPAAAIAVICGSTLRLQAQFDRGGLDLALVSVPFKAEGAILRCEDLIWVVPRDQSGVWTVPVPLALGNPDTLDHRQPSLPSTAPDAVTASPTQAAACPDFSPWYAPAKPSRC